jgi:hypothetical protein
MGSADAGISNDKKSENLFHRKPKGSYEMVVSVGLVET